MGRSGASPTTGRRSVEAEGRMRGSPAESAARCPGDTPLERPQGMATRIVAVVGPTAVGKTEVGIRLAEDFDGEIVSLDSRQMVRGLEIGTAKPTPEERRRVPHHILGIVAPDEPVSLAMVQRAAQRAIGGIVGRRRLPILVGGTGQYVWAVLEGWTVPPVAPDPGLRAELERLAQGEGPAVLHARLAAVDPRAAARIDPRNVRRVVRALEVYTHTGVPISSLQDRQAPPFAAFIVGLIRPRAELYARIDARIASMQAAGLEQEVRGLLDAGYGFDLPAMSSVGYGQWRDYFAGRIDVEEVMRRIRQATRRLVRQQATWFRADDGRIRWFDLSTQGYDDIRSAVAGWISAP